MARMSSRLPRAAPICIYHRAEWLRCPYTELTFCYCFSAPLGIAPKSAIERLLRSFIFPPHP